MTRIGLERRRAQVFLEMTSAGATTAEAMTYIDLMWPIVPEWKTKYRQSYWDRQYLNPPEVEG